MTVTRTIPLDRPLDLHRTIAPLRYGGGDPTSAADDGRVWRATRTPDGPATLFLTHHGDRVDAEAWGPGAGWAVEHAPDLLGATDAAGFSPLHPVVRRLHRRLPGLRLCRSHRIVETLIPTVVEQMVTSAEARRSYRRLVQLVAEPAPGPRSLLLPPDPGRIAQLPYWKLHPLGIERKRAETLRAVCRVAHRMEEAAAMSPLAAMARLRGVPGVGAWTSAIVVGASHGDPDAVVLGDFHFPHLVSWTLAGEPRGDDRRMLELLDEFAGQRARVVRLIVEAGSRPPSFAPKRRLHRIASH